MMMMMMMTMMSHMSGAIKTNEIEGSNHKVRGLIFILEASELSLFQETSSGDKGFSFYISH